MSEIDTRYQMTEAERAGGSSGAAAYNERVKQYYTPTPAPAQPTTPAPTSNPAPSTPTTAGTPSPYYARYTDVENDAENYLSTFKKPESEGEIQARKTQAAQAQIDAANKYYDSLLAEQRTVNEGRERGTNAISVLNGLSGSTDANNAATKTSQINQRDNDKINAEREAFVQGILSDIRTSAVEEARNQRLDAKSDAESILTRRKERLTQTNEQLTNLAKAGTTAEGLKATDPQGYAYLAKQAGGEEQLKSIFTLNRPQETILDKRVESGKYVIAYQNPLSGAVRIETVDLGIPAGYSKTIDAGDRILAMPDDWDGDPSKLISFAKGLSPDQQNDNALGWANHALAKERLAQDAAAINTTQNPAALQLVKNSLKNAIELAGASGRSGARRSAEAWFVGDTDYTNLVAETNTLRTNVLTLATDPSIKKFFGPQMSNADVQLMTSAGTTLNPELQSPEKMRSELLRLEDLINRMDAAVSAGSRQSNVITAPDGTPVQIID